MQPDGQSVNIKNNAGTHIEKPVVAEHVLVSQSDTLSTWRANPHYFQVDPEGNQLPTWTAS